MQMGIVGIIIGILLLSLMLLVHELGHFIVGRLLGFTVEEFSIFMGPRLLTWQRKGIRYSIKAFPIGASVQFAGEFNGDPESQSEARLEHNLKPGDFYERPRLSRALVALAGPAMNLLTGLLAFFIIFASLGGFSNRIDSVQANSLAANMGLQQGDKIVSINDTGIHNDLDLRYNLVFMQNQIMQEGPMDIKVSYLQQGQLKSFTKTIELTKKPTLGVNLQIVEGQGMRVLEVTLPRAKDEDQLLVDDLILNVNSQPASIDAIKNYFAQNPDQPLPLTVERSGQTIKLQVEPKMVYQALAGDGSLLGITLTREKSLLKALPMAFHYSVSVTKLTFKSIAKMITGKMAAKENLSGPIGVVSVISNVVKEKHLPLADKLASLLSLFGLISLSLGLMNLLPIPPLDGNLLLMTGIEAVRGKPVSEKVQNVITIFGLVIILALFVLGFYYDIARIFGF